MQRAQRALPNMSRVEKARVREVKRRNILGMGKQSMAFYIVFIQHL